MTGAAGVEGGGGVEGAAEGFEEGFGLVVVVAAVEDLGVEVEAGVDGEGFEEVGDEGGG
jgi:hypothetical protein